MNDLVKVLDPKDRVTLPGEWLREALHLGPEHKPFPWQLALQRRFLRSDIPRSVDVPTGLGKTAVMAIWLTARAAGASLPRRLVYVVDRRAVVDQATEVALNLREWIERTRVVKQGLGLESRPLPISTLRGQFIDNREWLEDPAAPAIVVGTVDMVGSRLLFEGYGTSRNMRPYHAALLGCDALLVLDEAHLVPPFEALIESVTADASSWPAAEADGEIVPRSTLLSLSATGRTRKERTLQLGHEDLSHTVVRRRLGAKKHLRIEPLGVGKLHEELASQAWALSQNGNLSIRCVVYADRRADAEAAKKHLEHLSRGTTKPHAELLVGGRRAFEREGAAARLKKLGFIAGTRKPLDKPAFLFATSAGEVGIDLDADHMVSDLVAWERMVQRLGRVNRRGDGDAEVIVVASPEAAPNKKVVAALEKEPLDWDKSQRSAMEAYNTSIRSARAQRQALKALPVTNEGTHDASPGALRDLRARAAKDHALRRVIEDATTPPPIQPALTRALVDSWAMTSLQNHPGRPEVGPWLRGWIDDDPQTVVVWRTYLPPSAGRERFFEAAPPHASELLETETTRVAEWLFKRAAMLFSKEKADDVLLRPYEDAAIVLDSAGEIRKSWRLEQLAPVGQREKAELVRALKGVTLIVDARIGGLMTDGLLDPSANALPRTLDDGKPWLDAAQPDDNVLPTVTFRVRLAKQEDSKDTPSGNDGWRERYRTPWPAAADEGTDWLVVEKWRHDGATEDDRSASKPQTLTVHRDWTEEYARKIARRLGLPTSYEEMLASIARVHDEGKRCVRWQTAFRAPKGGEAYAKTKGPVNSALLDGYRHEFGSIPYAELDEVIRALPSDVRELALHLVAAHHGFARPLIRTSGCDDGPPSALTARARDVALRFVAMQDRWGPWGLAWWEALLRSADQQASRRNEAQAPESSGTER